jgi:sialidase-1
MNKLFYWAGMLCVCLAVCTRARADMELSPVFGAGKDGYHSYRIPAMVVTTNNTVLAFCEGRKNGRGDSGDIDLLVKRSTDGGKTWGAQQLIWSDGTNTCGNPCPVVDRDTGVVWLLITWNDAADKEGDIGRQKSRDTRRVYISSSSDDGRTWSRPTQITASVKKPDWGWYATGPGNGIQLTRGAHAGRLVVPCNHNGITDKDQHRSQSHVIFSDDHGKTWQLGGSEEDKTNESAIVELSDGSLLHNMRSYHKKNLRAVATSKDGGMTWSPVRFDEALVEPVCQASILRCTWPENGGRSRILFANPASKKRENMTVRVSYDEGQTWPAARTLFPGPAAYSCLAILPDKSVACLFECGKTNCYETITLARFPLTWLEQEKSQ